ncbi:CBS domain-containing protein [Amycolatopsis sp. NPDC051128]|uniref:CBS domain-containing protein n=1 Tax=Amycolatopsis sp. NPDC051128 TaxID=3155412 RepID=UPI003441842C
MAGLDGEPRTAGSVMCEQGPAAAADIEVRELARLMTDADVRSAPVVDGGMVTCRDVLRATAGCT